MKILRVVLENFRGVKSATYEFAEKTRIKGCNGSGKSTIISAILWVLADKDYALISNPVIRPVGAIDEVTPSVTIDMVIGDKPVQVQKSQRLKRSKTGTVSLTNSYMINSVPKSEKDFKEYLTDSGFDFDKFLPCCHPGVLLSGINNKKERTALRNMLFEMASDITDCDVASKDPELAELAILLKDYDTEEVAAMQNNTLRKIRDNYGKDGEILRAKIEGLADAKVEVEEDIIKAKIAECDLRLTEVDGQIERKRKEFAEKMKKSSDLMDKKFRLSRMEEDANKEVSEKKAELRKNIFEVEYKIKSLDRETSMTDSALTSEKSRLKETQEKLKKNDEPYDSIYPVKPLEPKYNVSSSMDPHRSILIEMPTPLASLDTAAIHLYSKIDTLWYRSPFDFERKDSTLRYYELRADWQPGREYSLEVDSAAFIDIYGLVSKEFKQGIKVKSLDEYSTLVMQTSGVQDTAIVVQLLDKSENIVQQVKAEADGSAAFFYITPGVYYVRAFIDRNGNSRWDTGLYDDDLQPEDVYYYNRSIECKAKWDNTLQWNLTEFKRYLQKPGELVKQKNSKNKKKQMNRNADRAKRLGIEYVKQNTIKVINNESKNSKK